MITNERLQHILDYGIVSVREDEIISMAGELKRLRAAVDDFFEPEPESVRQKTIDAIMSAVHAGRDKPDPIEMTPEEIASAEKNFAAFDRLKAFSKYASEAAERARGKS